MLRGFKGTPLRRAYNSWLGMKGRCTNPRHVSWHNYGGRGITICAEWLHDFERFYEDMGPPPPKHTLDRKDSNGPYNKSNCRWATSKTQMRNTRRTVMTPDIVRDIRAKKKAGISARQLADELPFTRSAIDSVYYGNSWKGI